MEIDDDGDNAGLMFRTGECSTKNEAGPSYYVGLYPDDNKVKFGTMDDGLNCGDTASISLSYGTRYTLAVHGSGDTYTVYLDGLPVLEDITKTAFSTGSIGLRTYKAPSTFHSVHFSCDESITYDPTSSPTEVPTSADCFVKSDSKMEFEEAEDYCTLLGMHLASIHDDDENDAATDACDSCTCWIGLHCMTSDQYDFEWTDGSSWAYTNWNSGEPNNWWSTNEDCTELYSNGKWNDNKCTKNRYALCRKSGGACSTGTTTTSKHPSLSPVEDPSAEPTFAPSAIPSADPTMSPSMEPSLGPSS